MNAQKKVLIVDDEVNFRKTISSVLSLKGYDPVVVKSGKAALDIIRNEFISLVLLDLMLDDISGLEVLWEIKKDYSRIECILLTGHATQASAIEAINLGAYGYIQKPCDLEQLLLMIRRAIEKQETETAIKESEEAFRAVVEASKDAVVLINSDGLIDIFNPAAEEMFGYKKEDMIGKSFVSCFPEKLREEQAELLKECFSRDKECEAIGKTLELSALYRGGGVFPVEVVYSSGQKRQERFVLAVVRDIRERKKAEGERGLLATVIEQTGEGIIVTDKDENIQYVNPAFERITGYSKEEVFGKTPRILKSHKYDRNFYQNMWDTIMKGGTWRGHLVNRKKDGDFYESESSVSPVRDSSGTITNYVALTRDITDKLRLERQLRQAQKMEAIGTLAGGIAHDFNNILGAILGYTELTMLDIPEESLTRKNLMRILKGCHRAKELVNQILTFSRQREEERRPVEVKLIAKEVLYLLRASLPSTIEFRTRLKSQGTVLADPTQIHQIILNLCTNAGYAMKEKGGTLSVDLTDVEISPEDTYIIKNLESGPYIKLTVKDTGCGMERDVMYRIFEPYFTTKEIGEGTGLGLSVVHGIVISHGGAITVYSEPAKGTTFYVYLPRAEGNVKVNNTPVIKFPGGNECILFVDDENDIADTAKMLLERLGYEVITKNRGSEAFEVFREEPGKFHLTITDQTMPGMTGIELAGKILSLKPDMPVILCSGFSDDISMERIREAGIREFLLKPVGMKEMAETVRKVLANRVTG